MIDLSAGQFMPVDDAWRYMINKVEVLLPGTTSGPSPHWLAIACGILPELDQYHAAARSLLNAFIDRRRFIAAADWELRAIVFKNSEECPSMQFMLCYGIMGDEYGLWSVAFPAKDEKQPEFIAPIKFQRVQQ